jgi:ElaB/YqjD/DUF883 family membrane-anchored ribosome-binding protein
MARKTRTSQTSTADELGDIVALLREFERGLDYLTSAAAVDGRRSGGTILNMIAAAIAGLSERGGKKAPDSDGPAREEDRAGAGASRKLEQGLDARPFVIVAIAAGIGLLVGLLGRRPEL